MRLRNSQQSNSSNGFMRSAISLSTLYQLFQSRRRNVWTYLLPSTKPGLHTMTKKTDDILDKALEGLSLDQEFKDQQHPLCIYCNTKSHMTQFSNALDSHIKSSTTTKFIFSIVKDAISGASAVNWDSFKSASANKCT